MLKVALVAIVAAGSMVAPKTSHEEAPAKPVQVALVCFKTGEQSPPGSMTKLCYYDCLGSVAAITIPNTSICPLSINR